MKIRKIFIGLFGIFISIAATILILDCAGKMLLKKHNLPLVDEPVIGDYCACTISDGGILRYQFSRGFKGRNWFTDFSINSSGFRGSEFRTLKSAGTVRILCLGDSCTFGTAGLEDADTYPAVLEKILNKSQRSVNFEVINAGMPGYSVFEGFMLLKIRELMELKPDFVIVCYGWNDHMRFTVSDSSAAYQRLVYKFLNSHFALWRYFSYRRQSRPKAKKPLTPNCPLRVSGNQYKYYLSRIIDLAKSGNSKVLVMTAPWEPRLMHNNVGWLQESTLESFYLHPEYVKLTKKVCKSKDIALIDLYAVFESRKTDSPWDFFSDPFHYNKAAARMVALEVAKGIFRALEGYNSG
jgi:lysophospholipase L1-like esterase